MTPTEIISILSPYVSEHKQALLDEVSQRRTRHLTLVFEDIERPHNISAVLRTAECMGIQDVHFIRNRNDYKLNPGISKGAAKWLTLHHHRDALTGRENLENAFAQLRADNYRILATSLDESAVSIHDVQPDQPTAIVFGTEDRGISAEAAQMADGLVHIPMPGFTQSLNLSVSAAIIITLLMNHRKPDWFISGKERQALLAEWYQRSVYASDKILKLAAG